MKIAVHQEYRNQAPTLADLNISKRESAVAKRIASLPERAKGVRLKGKDGLVTISKG